MSMTERFQTVKNMFSDPSTQVFSPLISLFIHSGKGIRFC